MGWDWVWVMAFPLVSLLFLRGGVWQAVLKSSLFFGENLLLSCKNWSHVGEFPNEYDYRRKWHNLLMLCSCSQGLKSLRDMSLSDPNPCGNHRLIGTLHYYYFCCSFFYMQAIWILTIRILNQPCTNWWVCMYSRRHWMTYLTIPRVQSESLPCSSDITRFELI